MVAAAVTKSSGNSATSDFPLEAMMAEPVADWLSSAGAVCVGHEVQAGVGIPDLVAGIGDAATLSARCSLGPPLADLLQIRLLEYCADWRSEQELRDWAPRGYGALKARALAPLAAQGFLAWEGGGAQSHTIPFDPFTRLAAVELKLHNLRRGFQQAHSYRSFAESSYLAIPASRVTQGALDSARSYAVGLLAVRPSFVEVVVEPSIISAASAGRKRLASERLLAALGSD